MKVAQIYIDSLSALCWVHMERSIRRLNGVTAIQRQEIESEAMLCGVTTVN